MSKSSVEKLRFIDDSESLKYFKGGQFQIEHGYMLCMKKGRVVGKATNWSTYQ
jgi:hypothetical protein